jgi:GDP-L-fucose synthase
MNKAAQPKIYVAGHRGMVGSALVSNLLARGVASENLITRSRQELDLTNQRAVKEFFERERPDQVYLAAAKVGGIHANNTFPADFIYENLMIQTNVIEAAFRSGVRKLLFLGSSCIYPRMAEQPMTEAALLTGTLEPTNEPYAIAKIAGIKLCESYNRQHGTSHGVDYRSVMPTNLYGPGDNYHPENSHVLPALIRRFHEAKVSGARTVTLWGTGKARREFLYVDDMASASVHVMNLQQDVYAVQTLPMQGHINVGSGSDVTITEVAEMIRTVVGFNGAIEYDTSKPDGAPRKWMDSQKLEGLGWKPSFSLMVGLQKAYADFLQNPSVRSV